MGDLGLRSYIYKNASGYNVVPHNTFICEASQKGIPYFLLFCVLITRAFRGFYFSASRSQLNARFAGAFVSTCFVMMVHPIARLWIVWILTGIGLALWEQREKE